MQHLHRKRGCLCFRDIRPLLTIILCLALMAVIAPSAKAKSTDQGNISSISSKPLLLIPCLEKSEIVLTRISELSVFGSSVGNQDNITDSYRVFPFHLFRPSTVWVQLFDGQGTPRGILVPKKELPSGSHYFVLTYQDVAARMPVYKRFVIRVLATAADGSGSARTTQAEEGSGLLQEKMSGGVLGRIVVHDVMIKRGRLVLNRQDLGLKGRGPSFGFTRSYSNQAFDRRLYSTLGQGWYQNHERFLYVVAWGDDLQPYNQPDWVIDSKGRFLPLSALPSENKRPRYVFANGTHFKRVKNQWIASCTRHGTLEENQNGFIYISKDGTKYVYDKPPRHDLAPLLKAILVSNEPTKSVPLSAGDSAPLLANIRYMLPSAWPLRHIQDLNGNRITPEYAQTCIGPVLTGITDAVGRRLDFDYEPSLYHRYISESEYIGNPIRLKHVRGPDGIEMEFHYHPETHLLQKYKRDVLSETYAYKLSGALSNRLLPPTFQSFNLDRIKDANGNTMRYEYCKPQDVPTAVLRQTTALNPCEMVKAVVYADNTRAMFTYGDKSDNQRTVTDLRGHPTVYILNKYGNPVKRIEPLGKTSASTWQLDEVLDDIQMTSRTDPRGRVTHYEYDPKGNISRKKDANGNVTTSKWLPQYSELLMKTVNDHIVERNRYDERGNLIESMDEDENRTRFEYNQYGERIRKEEPNGRITVYTHDRWSNLKTMSNSQGVKIDYEYDIRGRLISMKSSDGRQRSYTYDALDRKIAVKEPKKKNLRTVYDPNGNIIKETFGDEAPIYYEYDNRNRNIRLKSQDETQAISYDANSNVISVTDTNGDTRTYRYNALDEEISAGEAARNLQLRYKKIYERLTAGLAATLPSGQSSVSWDERQKVLRAGILNRKGILFYDRENYELAIKYFTEAVELSNHSASFLSNAMDTYHKLKRYREAILFLEKNWQPYNKDQTLRSWYAWLLIRTDRSKEAVDIYEKLFAEGYRNEEDLKFYTDLLFKLSRHNELDKVFNRYLKGGRSEVVLLAQSKSLYKRHQYTAALKILDALQKSKAFDPNIAHEMIQNYSMLRQYNHVRQICDQLISGGYESAYAYYYKGDAEYKMDWLPEAKKSLEQALLLAPQDKKIESYINHVSGRLGQGDNTSIKQKIDPIPMPASFSAMQRKNTQKPDLNGMEAYYRHRMKCYRFRPGEPLTYTLYRDVHIENAAGVSKLSTLKFSFNPLYEKIYINKLLVKDRHGSPIATGNPNDYYVMDTQPDNMATYDQTLYLPVPSLSPGRSIEFIVTVQTKGDCGTFPFKRESLFSSYPIQLSALYIDGSSEYIANHGANIKQPRKGNNSLLWTVINQAAYKWEPEQVDYERFMPMVFLSASRQDWANAGSDYWHQIESRLKLDDETRRLAFSITTKASTEEDKIRQITAFVQKDLTYKPIEFGVRGTVPNTAATTLANKYGDCKDHAVLLRQLLNAVKVPACLVLVNTQWDIYDNLPSADQFNHMIVRTGSNDNPWYIDVTVKGMAPDSRVPMGLAGRQALILDPGRIRLERLPSYDPKYCTINSTRHVSIHDNKDVVVSEQVRFQGYFAAHMRASLKRMKESNHAPWAEKLIGRFHPEALIQSVAIEHLYENEKDLTIQLNYTLKEACEQLNDKVFFKIPSAWEHYFLKARPVHNRQTDFDIPYPLAFNSQVVFEAPPDYALIAVKPSRNDKINAFSTWRTDSRSEANKFHLRFSFNLSSGLYPAAKYGNYQQSMDKAIKSVNRKIILKSNPTRT